MHGPRIKRIALIVALMIWVPSAAHSLTIVNSAGPFSVMIGDNDGFGFGFPDNGGINGITILGNSMVQSPAEASDTQGAQFTDTFQSRGCVCIFSLDLTGNPPLFLTSLSWTVDIGVEGPASTEAKVYYHLKGDWVFQPGILETVGDTFVSPASQTFTFVVDPQLLDVADIRAQGGFAIMIDTSNSRTGTIVGFDYLQFDGVAETPIPTALPLFATGLAGLALFGRRRKKKAAALAA